MYYIPAHDIHILTRLGFNTLVFVYILLLSICISNTSKMYLKDVIYS